MCFPVSLWPLFSNNEQCKVLDIKFHAFQIPTFFFKSTIHFFKDMASCGLLDEGLERRKNQHSRKTQRGEEEGNSSDLECR